jgi:hypothetical protein
MVVFASVQIAATAIIVTMWSWRSAQSTIAFKAEHIQNE